MSATSRAARSRGFSFIEILIVMGIISVLVTMVVVFVPHVTAQADKLKSVSNLRTISSLMLARRTERVNGQWPRYSGKNFTLSLVATGQIDPRNRHNLEVLFSPGDVLYRIDDVDFARYGDVTRDALRAGGRFAELTSYAGRRNAEREHLITSAQEQHGTLMLADDDDGALHHADGIVVAYTSGVARFLEWADLGMAAPEHPDRPEPFLGDAASVEDLRHLSSR